MATCYQVFPLIETIRGGGQVLHTKLLAIDSDIEVDLDRIVDKFDTDASWFMHKLNISFEQSNVYPWAMIAFPEEYRLAGHPKSDTTPSRTYRA